MKITTKNVSKDFKEFANIIQTLYDSLPPATWIVNFSNGLSTSSHQHEGFNDITREDKSLITALRLRLDDKIYTLKKQSPSFFYHIKAGRGKLFGKYPFLKIPFFEERIGCCYNSLGDALTIEVSHDGFISGVHERILFAEKLQSRIPLKDKRGNTMRRYVKKDGKFLLDEEGEKLQEIIMVIDYANFFLTDEMRRVLLSNLTYSPKILFYPENIIDKRVNIVLFGSLSTLEESGTPPLVMEDDEEVSISIGGVNQSKFSTS